MSSQEAEMRLIGYVNPLFNIFPTPLMAVVSTTEGNQAVYPDGASYPLELDLTAARISGVKLLQVESQIPYRANGKDEFLFGVSEGHVLVGDQETVVRNLRLHLSALDPASASYVSIAEFIQSVPPQSQ
ncbi:hypothetical protein A2867_00445 [Candidatus Daviesbacteria bacterium RIFCSPHIGHO2_01_FULL_40_11]|uniref:Uncharacterized protein n=1 Tax=Candidatus Daviesbacteria bacterium RIFCSPHIGHO2_01_FULL_40_11 TaxID=1797762 RepID=A0A1F5JFF8_9BACT|nr:MAG: hypothetical protein A2867_00445 [Candidatus Daviesbacteria bacterium RIFCSPHIGHO2_01_FULL_40_11]OGE62661.1 MAG: hypothetical protein A2964_02735 [Candidatus Daviesbacteria bacterium RIFCSPLOWO2_01_FULL_40_27]